MAANFRSSGPERTGAISESPLWVGLRAFSNTHGNGGVAPRADLYGNRRTALGQLRAAPMPLKVVFLRTSKAAPCCSRIPSSCPPTIGSDAVSVYACFAEYLPNRE